MFHAAALPNLPLLDVYVHRRLLVKGTWRHRLFLAHASECLDPR
jgi:hypothetical protein